MKYNLTLLVVLCSTFIMAQNTTEPNRKNAIRANLLSPIYNTLNLSYERLLKSSGNSYILGLAYMDFNDFGNNNNDFGNFNNNTFTKVEGVSFNAEYKLHFTNEGFAGPYIAPFTRIMYYKRNAKYINYVPTGPPNYTTSPEPVQEKFNYLSLGIGFTVGYQFVLNNRVSFDFFGGPAFQMLLSEDKTTTNLSTGAILGNQDDTLLADYIPNQFIRGYGLRGGITIGFLF